MDPKPNLIGNVSLRIAERNPAQAKTRRPFATLHPTAHDPSGRPGGVRLSMIDTSGTVWVDLGRVEALALVEMIRAALEPTS